MIFYERFCKLTLQIQPFCKVYIKGFSRYKISNPKTDSQNDLLTPIIRSPPCTPPPHAQCKCYSTAARSCPFYGGQPSDTLPYSCMAERIILFTVTGLRPFNPSITHTHYAVRLWSDWVAC